ncbi:MAG: hypothetical protein K9M55_02595 [Candidatus Marinimicrobia bacterium]|nr:hypothetical protein [Candidatus Neomarinimicrobiota bacterium]
MDLEVSQPTSGLKLIDGDLTIYPGMGPHDPSEKCIIENVRVLLDIEVINRPDDMLRGINR